MKEVSFTGSGFAGWPVVADSFVFSLQPSLGFFSQREKRITENGKMEEK